MADKQQRQSKVRQSNPDWTWDEQILAFDLYLRHGVLHRNHPEVAELSRLLRTLPIHPAEVRSGTFRNGNGVGRKLADIHTHAPGYLGKKTSGSRIDREIWTRFGHDPALVAALSAQIRAASSADLPIEDDELGVEAVHAEGRIVYRMHRTRERDAKLRKRKLLEVAAAGRLHCQACDVELAESYGEVGNDVYECHHLLPLHAAGERATKIADVALLCPTCHRVAHRIQPWPSLEQLRVAAGTTVC